MKCSNCGKEIANDSHFCEYCGNPIKKSHKNIMWIALAVIFFSFIIIVVLSGALFGEKVSQCDDVAEVLVEETPEESAPAAVVDLALPSGTIWYTFNETGFYTYEEAVSQFGTRLPTIEQWKELLEECQWLWTGNGYKVTGNNGNTMTLPAAGHPHPSGDDGNVYEVGSRGHYWSSTPHASGVACGFSLNSDDVCTTIGKSSVKSSVRLVQD